MQATSTTAPTIAVHGFAVVDDGAGRITVEFPVRYELDQLDEFLAALSAHLHARAEGPFRMLVDVSQVEKTSTETRRRFTNFFSEEEAMIVRDCHAFALVVANAVQKGAITAIFWIKPVAWKTKVFNDRGEAERWLARD